jgi:hypothetical protein
MESDKTKIIWKRNLEVTLTIEELADKILCLDNEEQAILISTMGQLAESFDFIRQLSSISTSSTLTEEGRNLMRLIGEYS